MAKRETHATWNEEMLYCMISLFTLSAATHTIQNRASLYTVWNP